MLKTIVWPTDGSENAERALHYAQMLLDGDDSLLVAVHIVERADAEGSGTDDEDIVARTRALVSGIADQGRTAVARVVDHIGQVPAHAIADVAREVNADAIVIGTRGHSPTAGLVVGSVTRQLLAIAPCPVFAVPPGATAANDTRKER